MLVSILWKPWLGWKIILTNIVSPGRKLNRYNQLRLFAEMKRENGIGVMISTVYPTEITKEITVATKLTAISHACPPTSPNTGTLAAMPTLNANSLPVHSVDWKSSSTAKGTIRILSRAEELACTDLRLL